MLGPVNTIFCYFFGEAARLSMVYIEVRRKIMNLESLANFGEFIGGIGVILSLIYVAFQIRQNTVSRRTETYARTVERFSGLQ